MLADLSFSYVLIAAAVVVAIFAIVAVRTKVSAKTAEPTRRSITLTSPLSPDAAFAKLAHAKWTGRCKLADSDAQKRVLVLSSGISGWSWGFFYPLFIRPSASGSVVEIGVKPRAPQYGLIVSNNHKACAVEIEKALAA